MAISNSTDSGSTLAHSPLVSASLSLSFAPFRRRVGWALLLLSLLVTACGPEKSSNNGAALVAATQQIALAYQANGDLAGAQTQLEALDVANPTQWLVYVTETALAENSNPEAMTALARLTSDMGLQSESIARFAVENNLLTGVQAAVSASLASVQPLAQRALVTTTQVGTGEAVNAVDANVGVIAVGPPTTTQIVTQAVTQQVAALLIITPTSTAQAVVAAPAQPVVRATDLLNVRSGPGTNYDLVGALEAGGSATINGKNETGDWWQVTLANGQQGWVYGVLVETTGDTAAIAVAANIAPPPPTATPVPAVEAPTVQPTAVAVAPAPEAAATAEPVAAPAPVTGGNDFVVIEKHLWDVIENGGQLDGPSVTCGQGRELRVNVLDANGNRLNGVHVQAIYGAQEIFVTGSQGKGDGAVEFVLGGGQAVKIVRDADGREVVSDEAHNLSTKPWEIPVETLLAGNYCTNAGDCQTFVDNTGCYGHYSWTVTFKRRY